MKEVKIAATILLTVEVDDDVIVDREMAEEMLEDEFINTNYVNDIEIEEVKF